MKTKRLVAFLLVASMTGFSVSAPGYANASGTDRTAARERLIAHGVDAAQAEKRVAALTDSEARELATRIDELPAGGNIIGLFILIMLLNLFK